MNKLINTLGAALTGSALLLPATNCGNSNNLEGSGGDQQTENVTLSTLKVVKPDNIHTILLQDSSNRTPSTLLIESIDPTFDLNTNNIIESKDVKVLCEGTETAVQYVLQYNPDSITIEIKDECGRTEDQAKKMKTEYEDACQNRGYHVEINI